MRWSKLIPGYDAMRPFTRVMVLLGIFGVVPVLLANGFWRFVFLSAQMAGFLMLVVLDWRGQYWQDDDA